MPNTTVSFPYSLCKTGGRDAYPEEWWRDTPILQLQTHSRRSSGLRAAHRIERHGHEDVLDSIPGIFAVRRIVDQHHPPARRDSLALSPVAELGCVLVGKEIAHDGRQDLEDACVKFVLA